MYWYMYVLRNKVLNIEVKSDGFVFWKVDYIFVKIKCFDSVI